MKIYFRSDTHETTRYELSPLMDLETAKVNFDRVILCGDNVDFKNTEDKVKADWLFNYYNTMEGIDYLYGNHELQPAKYLKINDIWIEHGDEVFNGHPRVVDTPCNSKIIRFLKSLGNKQTIYRHMKLKPEHKDRLAARAKENGCSTIVVGHFHPVNVIDIKHNDVRIVILPRGETVFIT
ncbi:MAG: metallophosphoesterase family protein [Thiofilum sp.]|uniref:metallophosphoesterase family protein n=1 Tax=Thiofilum sp. TaxID=2212733 RepID=UPI0029F24B6B|nr:metallophosphoesterase family protein [Thiofilum sp.]